MRPNLAMGLSVTIFVSACAKGTTGGSGQGSSMMDWAPWVKKEDALVSTLTKKQDANLVRLAQQRALEQAIEEQAIQKRSSRSRRTRVPPSMYRTTEPPLPEPDFSLPVLEVPRTAPNASTPPPKQ
jgi:hypothetical protein